MDWYLVYIGLYIIGMTGTGSVVDCELYGGLALGL